MRTAINTLVLSSVIFGLGLLSPGLVGLARAQPATCVSGSPGSPECTQAVQGAQPPSPGEAVAPAAAAQAEPVKSARMPTHSFIFPTGNMTPAKEYSFAVHEMGLYNRAAYGVSDHLEISVGAPIFLIVGSLNARLSLTGPESPFRAVVGGSVWTPLYRTGDSDDMTTILQGTVTLGYQTELWNLHGSLSVLQATDGSEDDKLLMGSAGILVKVSDNLALIADISSVGIGMGSNCTDGCSSGDLLRMSTVGMKYMGKNWDMDVGLVFPTEIDGGSEEGWVMLPLISFHRH